MNGKQLKSKYETSIIKRSDLNLLDAGTALQFLADIESNGIVLHGIEGYWLKGKTIQPSMDESIYFRGGDDIRLPSLPGDTPLAKAKSFLQQRQIADLWFDFDIE